LTNGGVANEVSEVAQKVVGGLQGSPGLLVVVILNILIILGVGYMLIKTVETRHQQVMLLMDRCFPVHGGDTYSSTRKTDRSIDTGPAH